ncbi:YARHG domain-containing protein [Hyphobacterium sp.]|uniref:YARHG domain-containing protein n=1 Tax=Hyphobacterium sp. TaxID=2004662 RepID=UPI00374841F0
MKSLLTGLAVAAAATTAVNAQNCTRLPCEADYIWPETARVYVDPADVVSLSPEMMRLARNEIFARHGRIFVSEDLQAFFGARDWYRPITGEPQLSEIEAANVRLIHSIERGPDTSGQAFSEVISRDVGGYSAVRELSVEYREGFGREDYQETQPIRASGASIRLDDEHGRMVSALNMRGRGLGESAGGITITAFSVEWDENLLVILNGYMQAQPVWLSDELLAETNARIVSETPGMHGDEAVTIYEVGGQGMPDWGWGNYFEDDCFVNDAERFAWSHYQHGETDYPVPALSGNFAVTPDGIILRAEYYICSPHHEASTNYYTGYYIRYELQDFQREAIPASVFEPPLSEVENVVAPG